jgi:HD-GYP domain-containing protein (c-di-GMP phosphodiesterase class II)/DNA-binding CsgD family transcriptional regulator
LKLVELLAVLSFATDLGVGSPLGNQLLVTNVAVRFGRSLSLSDEALRELLQVALLRWIGCTSHAHELAVFFDDEIAAQRRGAFLDFADPRQMMGEAVRHAGAGRSPVRRIQTVAQVLAAGPRLPARSYRASCEVGSKLAVEIGLGEAVQASLGAVFERWDGKGWPNGTAGDAIPLSARIANVAHDAVNFSSERGVDHALDVLRTRSGSAHDPALVSSFCREAAHLLQDSAKGSSWESLLDCEPSPATVVPTERIHDALRAIADFADLKDPHTIGHSRGVAELAASAAKLLDLPATDVQLVERAALLHDLGRVGVPNGIWEKPARLTESEWERVRLHPYFAERATARCPRLAPYGEVAALHHERLDGSGYHRGSSAPQLGTTARLIAAADAYHAMTEPRAYRPALDANTAKSRLRDEVRAGRLDGNSADAVLSAAGHRVRRTRQDWPAGLSAREVEVLREAVRGASNRQIADRLHISERTVEHHLSHAYTKIGVSSRAAAALFAAQNDLLRV